MTFSINGYRDMHTAGGKNPFGAFWPLAEAGGKVFRLYNKNLPKAQDHEPQSGPILTLCFPFLSVVQLHVWKCTCVCWFIICVEATGQTLGSLRTSNLFLLRQSPSTGLDLPEKAWLTGQQTPGIHPFITQKQPGLNCTFPVWCFEVGS